MKNLRIAPFGIGEMLVNSELQVPTYQRSYAWDEVNVKNLLTDLEGAIERKKTKKADTYFLGSIVVVDRAGGSVLEVVDGQQRLATVSIIYAAIRDFHWERKKDKAAESYDSQFLRSYHIPSGQYVAKLHLNEIDDRCYAQAILAPPASRNPDAKWTKTSHKKIIAAYQCARNHIDAIASTRSAKQAIDTLFNLAEFMRQNAQVIRVTVDDEADAFTIFETLNDRHLVLSVADLLKNFLFQQMADNKIEEAKGNWREMQAALEGVRGRKDRTVDFVRQLWGSMHGLVREKDLFRDIKEQTTSEADAAELSSALASQAKDYVAILDPEHEAWDGYGTTARHALMTFNKLRVERIRSLLLAILNKFTKREVAKALNFLRSAVVRIVVNSGFNGTVEEQVFQIAVKVHKGEITNSTELIRAMSFVPNDTVFKAVFETMSVKKIGLAKFYLAELEDANKSGVDETLVVNRDERKVNLEHIIPLSKDERARNWRSLSQEEGAGLAIRLGNLALLPKKSNQEIGGEHFATKAKAYAECKGIYLTNMIAEKYTDWGAKQVNDRQRKLAALALIAWPVTRERTSGKRGSRTQPA
jgi:Protein of unknown function DUF262/Protein of unknown function (DUF1524)